jgi:hypothetical protein
MGQVLILSSAKKMFEDAKNAVLAALDSCPMGSSQAEGSPHSFQGGNDAPGCHSQPKLGI